MSIWLRIPLAVVICFVAAIVAMAILQLNGLDLPALAGNLGLVVGGVFFWLTRKKAKTRI